MARLAAGNLCSAGQRIAAAPLKTDCSALRLGKRPKDLMMDKQTEAAVYANLMHVFGKMEASGVREFAKKYMDYMNHGDYVEAVQYLEQVAGSLEIPKMHHVPTVPPPPSVRELAHVTGCRIDAPLNVVAEAALKSIAELQEKLCMASKRIDNM